MAFRRKLRFDSHNIKFTSNGIPYLSQFDNVSIKSRNECSPSDRAATPFGDGLLIHSPKHQIASTSDSPQSRLRKLSKIIARAVTSAGMDSPPAKELEDPMSREPGAPRITTQSGSLYSGTYGQVVTALMAAGLSITPCPGTGTGEATRLGALFVARPNGNGVELTKLTLWG